MKLSVKRAVPDYKGHTAEGELGLAYEDADLILERFVRGITIPIQLRKKLIKLKAFIEKNKHKKTGNACCL